MSWFTTGDVDGFLAEAGEFLRAERVRNSVILTVAENLRVKGQLLTGGQPAQDEPLFGWWRPGAGGNQVRGAFMHTPAFPVFLTFVSQRASWRGWHAWVPSIRHPSCADEATLAAPPRR